MVIGSLPKAKRAYYTKQNKISDYELIKELYESNSGWNISFMCKELGISRAAYYKWLHRVPTDKDVEDAVILTKIREIADSNNSLFGTMNMYYTLHKDYGFTCGHNRVYRIMCINDIKSTYRRKSKTTYTKTTPEETSENILNRDFNADNINEKWCTDVTEIKIPKTGEKLYISPIIDLYDRYPVGLSVSDRNDCALTNESFNQAHDRYPDASPLFHSDRGFQYTRNAFKTRLEECGMTQSMSRVSRCIDNGPCECFHGIFKDILFILYPNISSKNEMIDAIYGTLDYYINNYPQKRFKGKTCGEVRAEAEITETPIAYPIKQANRYIRYWNEIEKKKELVG